MRRNPVPRDAIVPNAIALLDRARFGDVSSAVRWGPVGRRLADGTLEDPGAVVLVVPLRLTVDRGETRGSRVGA